MSNGARATIAIAAILFAAMMAMGALLSNNWLSWLPTIFLLVLATGCIRGKIGNVVLRTY